MRHIRWRAVLVGAATIFGLHYLLGALYQVVPFTIHALGSDRNTSGDLNYESPSAFLGLAEIVPILTIVLCNFAGGVLARRLSESHPGLNGALASVVSAVAGAVKYALLTFHIYGQPDQLRSENAGILVVQLFFAALLTPVCVLCAYFGGRLGGRFVRRGSP